MRREEQIFGAGAEPFGDLLRQWRTRRTMSQLTLALDAGISTRHLSFLETGRSHPSREMVLTLTEQLDLPLRERNALLAAAGFAAAFAERNYDGPDFAVVRAAMERVLTAHEPYPALIIDKRTNLVAMNRAVPPLLTGVRPKLLEAPVSVMRLTLHPEGLAPRILNLPEWSAHLLHNLRTAIDATGDPALISLLREVESYRPGSPSAPHSAGDLAIPLRLRMGEQVLSFVSTVMIFGSPLEVTLSELALETLLPLNPETAQTLADVCPAR